MDASWVTAMDGLAAGGVINFDAPAYILGSNPRYVGNPSLEGLPMENPAYFKGIQLKNVPPVDEFKYNDQLPGQKKKTNVWGWILGGIGAVAVVVGGVLLAKGKIKIPESWKKILPKNWKSPKEWKIFKDMKMPDLSKWKEKTSKFFENIWGYIKKPFTWIGEKFSGKKAPDTGGAVT